MRQPQSNDVPDSADQRVVTRAVSAGYEAQLDGAITIHALTGESYVEAKQSAQLPDIDVPQLLSFPSYPTVTQAVRANRAALGA